MVKKFPFVLKDSTDWAIEAVPKATKTNVPRIIKIVNYKLHHHLETHLEILQGTP